MQRYWSELARTLVPYVPGEQPRLPGLIKLNTNECAYPPSPMVLTAVRQSATEALRLYPDPESLELRRALACLHQVEADEVFVGNGSDEVLGFAFAALMKQDQPLLLPDVTYGLYEAHCRLFGVAFEHVPVDEALRIRVDDYQRKGGAIVIANPNAPTGIALDQSDISRLVAMQPNIPILVDEAYIDFGGETSVPLTRDHPNLLVVRTFSKSRALAGLRVGYAIGSANLISALSRVRDSFNSYPLDTAAAAAATASLRDRTYFEEVCSTIVATRERLSINLARLGFTVLPSAGNFIFAKHATYDGAELAADLRSKAVLVRHFSGARTSPYIRVTIGRERDMDRLLVAVQECLAGRGLDRQRKA